MAGVTGASPKRETQLIITNTIEIPQKLLQKLYEKFIINVSDLSECLVLIEVSFFWLI